MSSRLFSEAFEVHFSPKVSCLVCQQKEEPESSQYAEVISTRTPGRHRRPQPTHRPAPPPPIYAQITHQPAASVDEQHYSLESSVE